MKSLSIKNLIIFNSIYISLFGLYALLNGNLEFLFYVSIVIFFFFLLLQKYEKLGLSKAALWGLSIWGLLHMAGGNVPVNGSVMYNLQLIPIVLKYDQFVHLFGFAAATIVGWELLKPFLKDKFNWTTISILLVMIGLGAGARNEIIEFVAVLLVPETNVGGYYNSSLDLVFDLFGAILAVFFIKKKESRS